jgi:hypothetical protein
MRNSMIHIRVLADLAKKVLQCRLNSLDSPEDPLRRIPHRVRYMQHACNAHVVSSGSIPYASKHHSIAMGSTYHDLGDSTYPITS